MYKYIMKIAYDGSRYSGWQIQPNASSIQSEIQKILEKVLRKPISIQGSGRTDQGVHAKAQMAHFEFDEPVDIKKLLLSLNGLLSWDIRIKEIAEIDNDFHARYSAKGKIYHYHFWKEGVIDPMFFPYRLHMRKPIDFDLIKEATKCFLGKNDFTTFANLRESKKVLKNPIRDLRRLDLIKQEGGYRLEFEGNGFLYKMVRNIVGVLIEVGQKRRSLESIEKLFGDKDRKSIGAPAPAKGLFLQEVLY